jgi:hypothetical protein
MSPFDRYFRPARPVRKALLMPRLLPLVASVAVAALATLTQLSSAHAETPAVVTVPAVAPQVATPTRLVLAATSASPMGSLMVVLDVLGIMEKDAPKPAATTRTATFLSPEPPKTPLFYSSLVVAKF